MGYAQIQLGGGSSTPPGVAIFGFRQNNVLVSEAGVPASPAVSSGRIYAEVSGPLTTGLAIANPNGQPATVTFYFTDQNGTNFGSGNTTIAAGGQIAAFLDQAPFNGGSSISGSFTFSSSVPVAVVALRGFTNERAEFLLTTLPVSSLTPGDGTAYFPDFADGGGWRTEVVLVNPTDDPETGSIQFFGQGTGSAAAQPIAVTIDDKSADTFTYTIPGRSSRRLQTAGSGSATAVGSIRMVPSVNNKTPSGLAIFSFRNAGITVSETGVSATVTGTAFRLYVELSSPADGSIESGIAAANGTSTSLPLTFELTDIYGVSTGLTGSATLPGNGQMALFLNQIPGFESLPASFRGVLRITTTAPGGLSVVALRGRYNERGDFLITTIPAVNEALPGGTQPLYFPHLADGGGYTTQFIVFSGSNQAIAGGLQFFAQSGQPLKLPFTASALAPGTTSQRNPYGPVPQVTFPALTIQGDFPCTADAARAEFWRFYPVLVHFIGSPYTMVRDGVTWWWDTTSGQPSHGWDSSTNIIRFPPGQAGETGLTGNAICQAVYRSFVRETAHMFWDVGPTDISYGPQWLRQAQVGAALQLAGADPFPAFDYDVLSNEGSEKVNGVSHNAFKYGDALGSLGRTTSDSAATQAFMLLEEVLAYDTGEDLLPRLGARILTQYQASGSLDFSPKVFAPILNDVSNGRTMDGMPPGDWLLAQPVANSEGATGRYLAVFRSGSSQVFVAAFERSVNDSPSDSRIETPLANLAVNLTFIDTGGAVRNQTTVQTQPTGNATTDIGFLGNSSAVFLVKADASIQGQSLSAANVVYTGPPFTDGQLVIFPMNADGTALRPELVSQMVVSGADSVDTSRSGMLIIKAKPGASVDFRYGNFHAVLSQPIHARPVPMRVP